MRRASDEKLDKKTLVFTRSAKQRSSETNDRNNGAVFDGVINGNF